MTNAELERYKGIVNGMSVEELNVIADILPVEICYNRIGRELSKSKVFKIEVATALEKVEGTV